MTDDPIEKLDQADEQMKGVRTLVSEAEEEVADQIAEAFGMDVSVAAEADEDGGGHYFDVTVYPGDLSTIDFLDGEDAVETMHAMELRVRDPATIRQRREARNVKDVVADLQEEYGDGAPLKLIITESDLDEEAVLEKVDKLKQQGELYQPNQDHYRTL